MNILINPLMMQLLILLLFVTAIRSQLLQGHNCGIPTNSLRSTCRPIGDCHHSLSRITGPCGVENFRMLVCCEPREDIFSPHPQVLSVASMSPQIHNPQPHDGVPLLLPFNQPYEALSYPQPFFSQFQHLKHPVPLAFEPQFPGVPHQSELAQISAGPRPLCQSQIPVEPQRLHQPHFPVNPLAPNQQPSISTGLESRKNSTSISQQKCREYSKYVYEKDEDSSAENGENKEDLDTCGLFTVPLVVNGERAGAREFPHQALLFYQHARGDTMECTGSLISENFVMSAAHCSDIPVIGRPRYVVVGDLDYQTDDDDADPQRLKVIDIINHPSYRAGIQEYDITLLKLESNVIFNAYRRPACLNTNFGISETHAIASGWGATRFGGKTIRALQKVRLALTKDENECRIPYLRINPPINIDQEIMLCAGDVVGTNSTCQGDSGGPLQIKLQEPYCMHSIIGVTSFGVMCGMQIPAVFTRVSYFVPWIESIVWPKNSN